jgi:hypothetical protein
MKIEISEDGTFVLKEVYDSVEFETDTGERLFVCMRDGVFEIASVERLKIPCARWYKAENGEITLIFD